MASIVATIPAPLMLEITLNSPDSSAAMATYAVFTFILCVLEALTLTSANNATHLIKKLLSPTFDSTANLAQQAQMIKTNATQLRELIPPGTSANDIIDIFAIFGILTTLDTAIFDNFLTNYNREYPTGIGASLSATLTALVTFTNTMSRDALSMKTELSHQHRALAQEHELLSFFTRIIAVPTGPTALVSALNKHPQKHKLIPKLLSLHSSPSSDASTVPPGTSTSLPCIDCKLPFTPPLFLPSATRCRPCHLKRQALRATAAIVPTFGYDQDVL